MSETLKLICAECGNTQETPVYGWISIKPSNGSSFVSEPPGTGDFCSIRCLTDYISKMAIQASF